MDSVSKEFLKLYSLLLENRDPKEERRILQNQQSWSAYEYARHRIRGRWPEAEEFIKKDFVYAYYYARNIIKGRWPEAEEYIKKNDYGWNKYLELICKKCNGNGVISLGIAGAEEECFRCNGGGFDLD